LAPYDPTESVKTIMVPLDGSPASLEAVALASDIAKRNKGKVYAVHVIEVKRTLPLDAQLRPEAAAGEEMLAEAERVAREHKVDLEGEILQAREAGHAIIDEALERGVDLIVVGTEHSDGNGAYQLGRVAPYILSTAPCGVWVWRHSSRSQ
jgi:nucleotide-binding universal stress UspA family protein